MDNVTLTKYLTSHKKLHLKRCFTNLLDKEHFDQDLFNIDLETLENQLHLFEDSDTAAPSFSSYTKGMETGCSHASQVGIEASKQGLVGCLLLAGGQGTRLGWSGPKGTFSVTLIKKKSLFQLFAEKVKAASVFVNRDLPLAIMTSPLNEAETRQFFQKNNFFGLKPHQIFIFSQTMLPFLDFNKCLVHTRTLAKGPDGNGSCFESFFKSHVGEQWQKSGIEYLNIVLIDNPLADPYDFELLGHLLENNNEVALKSCYRKHPHEKVGVIVEANGKPVVVEYSELPKDLVFKREPPANLSMFALRMDFAKRMASKRLPLHKAQKKMECLDFHSNQWIKPESPNIWKYEKFLFDILPYSKSTSVWVYPRADVFSALKNLEGEDSLVSVQKDLLNRERKIFEAVTRRDAPNSPFELDPQFYYPTEKLIERWQSQELRSYLL